MGGSDPRMEFKVLDRPLDSALDLTLSLRGAGVDSAVDLTLSLRGAGVDSALDLTLSLRVWRMIVQQ